MRAVVFDWDGTLVNSQTVYVTSWRVTLAAVGHEASSEELRYVVGRTFPDSLRYFATRLTVEPRRIERLWRRDYRRRLEAELDVYPDAVACAEDFNKRRIPLAIATQAPRHAFNHALVVTGLNRLGAITVTRSDVRRPKPAPDLYIEVCRRLGERPQECLAIEDSLVGVASARDAGLRVVGIARNTADLTALDEAADIAVSTLEPNELIRQWDVSRERV